MKSRDNSTKNRSNLSKTWTGIQFYKDSGYHTKVNSLKKSRSQVDWIQNEVQKQLLLQMHRINDHWFLLCQARSSPGKRMGPWTSANGSVPSRQGWPISGLEFHRLFSLRILKMNPLSESKHFLKNVKVLYLTLQKLGIKGQDYEFLDFPCCNEEKKNCFVIISNLMSEAYMEGKIWLVSTGLAWK